MEIIFVKIVEFRLQKLNTIEQKINSDHTLIKNHVHPSNGVVSPTLANFVDLTETALADISSTKIKY
jgi:hypothetical protein